MADVGDRNPAGTKKGFLEGKDAQQPVNDAPHGFDPMPAPGPYLGSDQIDHRNSQLFQLFSHAKVKIRRIGQDGQIRLFAAGRGNQFAKPPPDTGEMNDHFSDPHNREIFGPDDRTKSGCPQVSARAPEEIRFRPSATQFGEEQRGIVVSRSFTGGN